MRSALVLLLCLGACQTAAPALEPRARPAVKDALADLLAVAAAPATDADASASRVTTPEGEPGVTLAEVRALLDEVTTPDGRFVYEVEEYVAQEDAGDTWHVLRVVFERFGEERPPLEAEFGFVARGGTFRLGRLLR